MPDNSIPETYEPNPVANPALETRLWLAQRISAMVLGIAVIVHLGTIIYAVRGGLSAAEIIARVGGQTGLTVFYGIFVAAVAVYLP